MGTVGLLVTGIVHDFNNVLTVVVGYAELLRNQMGPDDPGLNLVERILDPAQRAAVLVHRLMSFSRKQVTEPNLLNLNEVVADVGKMLQRIIDEDIRLDSNLAPDLWPVLMDPGHVEQILINLVINARDAMPAGGRLLINTDNVVVDRDVILRHEFVGPFPGSEPSEYVILSVSDTGVCINQKSMANIFEPFFTTRSKDWNSGLGLTAVWDIVRQSGGGLQVHSREREGTTFWIYLPRATGGSEVTPQNDASEELPAGKETVLLVEDESEVREVAARILRWLGYTVLEATEGGDALRVCKQYKNPIQLLVTDVVMPGGLDGRALAEKLAAEGLGARVLYISGHSEETVARHGVSLSQVAFLPKPFSAADLAHRVREVLDCQRESCA
jgi:CheY-like chemotaxis protein